MTWNVGWPILESFVFVFAKGIVCIGVVILTEVIHYVNIINKPLYVIYRDGCTF